jgi:biopolymer transport protein ExbB
MKNKINFILTFLLISTFNIKAQEESEVVIDPFDLLINEIDKVEDIEKRYDFSRFNTLEEKVNELKRIKSVTKKDLENAVDLSDRLLKQFDDNEQALSALEEKLTLKLGNLGEMFGVVKQVAGQTKGEFENSITNIDHPDRTQFLEDLAQVRTPSILNIRALWKTLLEEIQNSGEIVTFLTPVISADGNIEDTEVVRLGTFNTASDGKFLKHLIDTNQLQFLPSQPAGMSKRSLKKIQNNDSGIFDVDLDPTRGSLTEKLIQNPNIIERINQGGIVGYFIILLGLIGLALSAERIYTLRNVITAIEDQEKDTAASDSNLLGELILLEQDNAEEEFETLELMLDEKIQSFMPAIETRVNSIKLIATIAPLLGLLGTVIGMIATFQSIQLFGTGDPKLMAGGISQALVTTMLGLIVAAPLLFLHSYADSYAKRIIDYLEEKASGIIAQRVKT